jgi:hypothetical protein
VGLPPLYLETETFEVLRELSRLEVGKVGLPPLYLEAETLKFLRVLSRSEVGKVGLLTLMYRVQSKRGQAHLPYL